MKRLLWTFLLLATPVFAQVNYPKNVISGSQIQFWTNPASVATKQATITNSGNLQMEAGKTVQADSFTDSTGLLAPSFPQGAAITGSLTVNGNAVATGQTPVINYVKFSNSKGGTWADTTGVTSSTESVVANLPRGSIYSTGIKLLVGASGATGTVYQIPLDNNALNKVMSVSWAQKAGSSYVDGEIVFDVAECDVGYTSCSPLPLTTDNTSNQTLLQKAAQDYLASFVTTGRGYLQLQWYRLAGTGVANDFLDLNDVVVTAGQLSLTPAPITAWVAYTPTVTGFTAGSQTHAGKWRRVGDSAQIRISTVAAGNGGTTNDIVWSIPSSIGTIDASKLVNTSTIQSHQNLVGTGNAWNVDNGTSKNYSDEVFTYSSTSVAMLLTAGANQNALRENNCYSGAELYLDFTVPISNWSTPLITGAESTEYVWNSNATTSCDLTSFGYGPGGVNVRAFAPTGTTYVACRVRFQRPIQATDLIMLEFNDPANNPNLWVSSKELWSPQQNDAGTTSYGVNVVRTSVATDIDVRFYSATDKGAGDTWSAATAWKWRVKKVSAPALVGHNIADANNVGLVSTTTQTFAGAKTFNDATTFKAVGGTVAAGGYDSTGSWTLGPANPSIMTHTLNLTTSGGNAKFGSGYGNIRPGFVIDNATQSSAIGMSTGAGTLNLNVSAGTLYFNGGTYADVKDTTSFGNSASMLGAVSSPGGVWTLGSSGGTQTHTVNGKLNITSAHDNCVSGNVCSGTYSPTFTNVQNWTTNGLRGAQFSRVGNIVTVSFWVYMGSASATAAIADMTLPIASTANQQGDIMGTVIGDNNFLRGQIINGSGKARIYVNTAAGANKEVQGIFT